MLILSLFLSFGHFASAETNLDELQTSIIQLYSKGDCEGVRKLSKQIRPDDLRPNVLAIYAYCEPANLDPEKLFALAEQKSPTGDLILVLHGKYRWKKNKDRSEDLWEKVLMFARNDYFRDQANEYLANVATEKSNAHAMNLSPNTGFATFSLAGSREDHPQNQLFSYDHQTGADNSLLLSGDLTYRTWNPSGSVAYHYQTDYQKNAISEQYQRWNNFLEVPIALHVSSNKDIIFRPLLSYQAIGAKPFNMTYGIGMKGAVYQDHYVQSVQATIFTDNIFTSALSPEQGAHYRFDYAWDFYPKRWFISTLFAIEHVSAESPTSFLGQNGLFEMSHNDFILDLKFERNFSQFSWGIDPKFIARMDTNPSSYYNSIEQKTISKARQDWELHLNTHLSMPLFPSVQIFAWYELAKVFSNFGNGDYLNRNFNNQTIGLGLKTSLSTY